MTDTQRILDFAAKEHELPASVRVDAERLLADTLTGGAAGANSPEARLLLPAVTDWGTSNDARTLIDNNRLPTPSAAFFNGFAIHCLEWDAVHEPAVVHALSVVTAALLAASDRRGGSDASEFVTALAVGVDIASGLGIAATGPMAFFRPATAGIIGAALALARLEGLDHDQYGDVLGLAYSYAGGTMQAHVEASIALPLQIANAARSAISAVDLVKAGMNGPHDVFEGPFGYGKLIEDIDLSNYTQDLGKIWRISEVSIKPFPSGRASHGALGALADIRHQHDLALDDVQSIELFAPPLIHRLVGRPFKTTMTPAYARLCMPLLAPMMLRDGVIDPDFFCSEGLSSPELAALGEKVKVTLDGSVDTNALAPQRLVIILKNGDRIERQIDASLGSPEAPMSTAQSQQKHDLCRRLASVECDPRIFENPLAYATEPQ
ncbi:MAG: hypothetical protein Pars2KO_28240 [Parasphingorhabdus sp.]